MERPRAVVCRVNEELATFMWTKRQEMASQSKGISENLDSTLWKAYSNVCNCKTPIKTLKDLSEVNGVGKWMLRLLKEFFETELVDSDPEEEMPTKGKKKGTQRYMPRKNSVAYALLITLYRGITSGSEYMRKQELIDAAEASGLSRVPIVPEKAKGKAGHFGSSTRDWYTGWNCMKTLITKGLVAKSSNPAKYMLTQEGQEVARECLSRSGLVDPVESVAVIERESDMVGQSESDLEGHVNLPAKVALPPVDCNKFQKSNDVPPAFLERFLKMGYSAEQILRAVVEVSKSHQNKDISSLWPAVLCCLRENQIYGLNSRSQTTLRQEHHATPTTCQITDDQEDVIPVDSSRINSVSDRTLDMQQSSSFADSAQGSVVLRACSSTSIIYPLPNWSANGLGTGIAVFAIPPFRFGEKFDDIYEVVLILDDREQFAKQGSRSRRIIENISGQFSIHIEVRRLPVGDAIWIARNKESGSEYVLDFIVERKRIDDLSQSIKDNRYKDQKLKLLRCGLKKLIYLVEGDANSSEAAERIKTACFTTEILEGFDVQRTSGLADTLRKYGYLTHAITQYYKSKFAQDKFEGAGVCPTFNEFIRKCQDLDKMTISDVFGIQLMQVPHVTEQVAAAVLDLYPTLLSLARAYSLLEEDIGAQEDMLRKQTNNVVSALASKNIFQLVWGN
ncbi:ERCC4 domain [Dillenia turbinata]|uniref:Crossover junction endonuclease MUS81 n=1 Tax=Dillenia turbinata TaxID=194707 RepID=A0AAN8V8K2_9MAGN